ncbi:MAG: twin-arginine translocation signal domain-containing protein [Geminicoccaceae bacterium]
MKKDQEATATKRRDFLKFASVGAVSGAAAAVVGAPAAEAKVESETSAGYRETAHVKQAYDLARF